MRRSARLGRAGARISRKIRPYGAADELAAPMALHRVHGRAAGAFGEGEMLEAVRRRLDLPAVPDGQLIPMPPEPLRGPRVLMRRRKTEQAHICMGVRAFNYFHADRFV